ncbi:hypothetical protein K435DRAFT_865160 [Dendrothele bispora CBS 962.96]|uniref:Uncharacterized protein n=1 Tax=Dendrothele bispora (strain CBS 962.96) TaxID=1314807 RepID=A0A4V4HE39_DENBC|nr:hypothetical protein K435DRAFT_865160 [Dendrothele bispora CBS 962.96]
MSLESGVYIIRNRDNSVNRNLAEDRSLNPKRVVLLPPDAQSEDIKKKGGKRILNREDSASLDSEPYPDSYGRLTSDFPSFPYNTTLLGPNHSPFPHSSRTLANLIIAPFAAASSVTVLHQVLPRRAVSFSRVNIAR